MKLNQKEIESVIYESVKRLMEYGTEYPDKSYSGSINALEYLSWEKNLGEEDEIENMLQEAGLVSMIPFDFYFPGGRTGSGPDDYWDDVKVNNREELSQLAQKAEAMADNPIIEEYGLLVDSILETVDLDEFEKQFNGYIEDEETIENPYEPDPDMMPGGHDYLNEDRRYDTWLGHRDLPGSDGRFFNVEFYIDKDGQIKYTYKGDSNGKTPPFEPGQIPWLDKQVEAWMNSPEGKMNLKANLFLKENNK